MTWSHRIIIILLSLIFILSCFCKTSIIIIIWTTTESSIFHVNNNSLINWACWRQAPVIKCLRFFLGGGDFYLFMLWVCHPTLQILTLDRFSDQYLLGKCNGVPFLDFLFTKWTLTNLGRGGGASREFVVGVCCLTLDVLTPDLISDQYLWGKWKGVLPRAFSLLWW